MTRRILCVLCVLPGCLVLAQTYKCDWSVVGIGGGDMAGSAYKCGSTVGQTAVGQITGPSYWALIGFWQTEGQTGVREAAKWSSGPVVETRLYTPQPNPSRSHVAIRYSLCAPGRASVRVCDLAGRVVRTLVSSEQQAGRYSVTWNGNDDHGRTLANGVYFARMTAGEYRATEKVVLQK